MLKLTLNKKILWSLMIILVVVLAASSVLFKPGTDVNGVMVKKTDVEKFVEEKGVVKAVKTQKVYSKVGGEVEIIMALPGDLVKKGDPLVSLVATDYELKVLAMESQKRALEKTLEALLKPKDTETLAISLGDVKASKNAMAVALQNYENGKTLFMAGSLSDTDLKSLKSVYDQGVIVFKQAEAAYALLKKGPTKENVDQTKAQIDALSYDIQQLIEDKERLDIVSPISGTVVEKAVEAGQFLIPGEQTYEIADLSKLYIEVELLVSDAYQVKTGTSAVISLEDTDISVTGKVERVYPKAYSKISDLGVEQKRIRVDIALDEQVSLLYGAEVSVKLTESIKSTVLSIPDSALFTQGLDSYVFVVQGGRTSLTKVKSGLKGNEKIEILSGLSVGQVVVDTPDSQLGDNEKVKLNLQTN